MKNWNSCVLSSVSLFLLFTFCSCFFFSFFLSFHIFFLVCRTLFTGNSTNFPERTITLLFSLVLLVQLELSNDSSANDVISVSKVSRFKLSSGVKSLPDIKWVSFVRCGSMIFRPSATKSGRPYGVTSASSSSSWMTCPTTTPHWLTPPPPPPHHHPSAEKCAFEEKCLQPQVV